MSKLRLKQKMKQGLNQRQLQMIKLLPVSNADLLHKITEELIDNPVLAKEEDKEGLALEEGEKVTTAVLVKDGANYMPPKRHVASGSLDSLMMSKPAPRESFREELYRQVGFLSFTTLEKLIAKHIIGSLTTEGLLPSGIDIMVAEIMVLHYETVTAAQVERVLHQIQRLGPPGIAARDAQECLLLQLQMREETPVVACARTILTDYFKAFTKKHYPKIMAGLGCSREKLKEALELIQHLRPYPIVSQPNLPDKTIVHPDFMVTYAGDGFRVTLLGEKPPRLTIRKEYEQLLQAQQSSPDEDQKALVTFIQDKMNRAKWFIQALEQRKNTLLKIMRAIVRLQSKFFETGEVHDLRPIFLRNVAAEIGMDISTVSRAIAHKAVQTDFQIYPLKYFFSEAIQTKDGGEVSSRVVKKMLVDLVGEEDKSQPYTDEQLTAIFQDRGFLVARRTVAKYRQKLDIPVARLRIAF